LLSMTPGRACVALLGCFAMACGEDASPDDPVLQWSVAPGFSVQVDAAAFRMPTAIAFVPEPGVAPEDPLYFVTELRGRIRVVTNDRSVHTFAEDFFRLEPERELPSPSGEQGLVGLCLAPEHGFVFATFAYQDARGAIRNNVMRFSTKPRTFATRAGARLDFARVFQAEETGPSHQIGGCQVRGGELFVGVGDGYRNPLNARSLSSTQGKILRLSLTGDSLAGNPFFRDEAPLQAASAVWAYGLRNPQGLVAVGRRLFAADNGPEVDRLLEVEAGRDYLWSGSDWSLGSDAISVFSDGNGTGQLAYLAGDDRLFPSEYRGGFYVAVTGNPGFVEEQPPGVVQVDYDLGSNRVEATPRYLLRYRGSGLQVLAGMAFGPDGLYFAPMFGPSEDEMSSVLKLVYKPEVSHPFPLARDARSLIASYGCLGCHDVGGSGGRGGPSLQAEPLYARVRERLDSAEYLAVLRSAPDEGEGDDAAGARRKVLESQGREQVRAWIEARIRHPNFDDPSVQMPHLGISTVDARTIAEHLVDEGRGFDLRPLKRLLPEHPRQRHLIYAFGAGVVAAAAAMTGILAARRFRNHRVRRSPRLPDA